MSDVIVHIRKSIALACEQERESRQLERFLQARLPYLHPSITLPRENAAQALLQFVKNYIEHVPDFLEALQACMAEAKIEDYGKIFITIAEDFFLQPPDLVKHHYGLHALIDEAYLAHRLMEELNDRLELSYGRVLAPMDMTFSNLIIHDILGDEFANQLDLAVHYAIEALFQNEDLRRHHQGREWEPQATPWADILRRWPSLAGDGLISLKLRDREERDLAALH